MESLSRNLLLAILLAFSISSCRDLLGSGGSGSTPDLVDRVPSPGATGVSVLTRVYVEFSGAVDPVSLPGAVKLWSGGRSVAASLSLANRNRVVVVDLADPLDFGTEYRVTVSSALGFRGGDSLAKGESWEFRTEGKTPPVPAEDSLRLHVESLAHDSMQGRGSGTTDELRAAEYLRERFLSYGLQEPPGGALQSFEAYSWRSDSTLTSRNVLAVLEGAGALADEWIVVGAHYDHIGYRNLPDESAGPNNGADDNASGTALVLEMARSLRFYVDGGGMGSRGRRSVVFAAFGAEEEGLLGSCAYVYGGAVAPLGQTGAMMNFDMVGRLRDNTVFLSGGETSWIWGPLVGNSNAPGLNLAFSASSCTGCTDHACFWREGVPFLGFFTGYHEDYHAPGDDAHLINFPGMVQIGEVALRVLSRLLVMSDKPPLTGPFPPSG